MMNKDSIRDGKATSYELRASRSGCLFDAALPVERRASPPGWTGATPVAPPYDPSGGHGGESLLDALLKRLVSADRRFGIGDRFEACLLYTSDAADDLLCV